MTRPQVVHMIRNPRIRGASCLTYHLMTRLHHESSLRQAGSVTRRKRSFRMILAIHCPKTPPDALAEGRRKAQKKYLDATRAPLSFHCPMIDALHRHEAISRFYLATSAVCFFFSLPFRISWSSNVTQMALNGWVWPCQARAVLLRTPHPRVVPTITTCARRENIQPASRHDYPQLFTTSGAIQSPIFVLRDG